MGKKIVIAGMMVLLSGTTFANDILNLGSSPHEPGPRCMRTVIQVSILGNQRPLAGWTKFGVQELVMTISDQIAWMRRIGRNAQRDLGMKRDRELKAAITLRDRSYQDPVKNADAQKRLIITSQILDIFVRDPAALVNLTELTAIENALVEFISSDAPVLESFDRLDDELGRFYRYHRASSLAEWMGLRREGALLYRNALPSQ